jgi:hypothetical protein
MPSVPAIRGRRRRTLCATAALALASLVLSSCGQDSNASLSGRRASDLRTSLDQIEDRVAKGDCTGASKDAGEFRQKVDSLPSRVDRDLRDALRDSATRLESLVSDQCKPAAEETPAETPPVPDENPPDQQDESKKDKKPKKPKKGTTGTTGQEGSTGVTGQEGSTGVTGQEGTTLPPEGG